MDTPKVFESEYRFCLILWERQPVKSGELVNLCRERLGWKPTTTYTVLKKLCVRGIFQNHNSMVTSLISQEEFYAAESEAFVEERFSGSLPAFLAAFIRRKKLTDKEIEELQRLIDASRREK